MFNQNAKTTWIPYKIPPTPVPEEGKQYALSFSSDATPDKNPSQFLRWQEVGGSFPSGQNLGDLLYWNPNSDSWEILSAPNSDNSILYWRNGFWSFISSPPETGIHVLVSDNGVVRWAGTEDCEEE
jgi:hypothetical protein